MSPAGSIKDIRILESVPRYLEGGGVGGPSFPLLPPPLYPSPAVLLHIKYVMETVCDSMCFTDVTIITASDTLRAHRSVLAAHSSFLCYLLTAGLADSSSAAAVTYESEDPVLHFPHYPSLYVRMLLQFFYTGEKISNRTDTVLLVLVPGWYHT
jgi:hypothetical protein